MRMTIVGKSQRAGGSECIIFGHVAGDDSFAPVTPGKDDAKGDGEALSAHGRWEVREMRPGAGAATAPAFVGWNAGDDYCRTTGRLIVVSHRWSGVLQFNDIGRKYTIDLYSRETRLVLLDVVNEIMVDVTSLAATADGVLALPKMKQETLIEHIRDHSAWFRFLERDDDFEPGLARRTIERFRRRRGEKVRLRLLSSLLPMLAARPAHAALPPAPAPPPAPPPAPLPPRTEEGTGLRDELRLLAAAVEGLARRGAAQA